MSYQIGEYYLSKPTKFMVIAVEQDYLVLLDLKDDSQIKLPIDLINHYLVKN
jgi:hypothetical protein